jgi:mannose-6-phosphate isomerase-like protein (cupin superfamily)
MSDHHTKAWGYERWICNTPKYCGKILHFSKNAKFSMHFHMIKDETWYVNYGKFIYRYIDTDTADVKEKIINKGDVVHIPPGLPHQLENIGGDDGEEGEIFEVSTEHFENDSYRVMKGDSQTRH